MSSVPTETSVSMEAAVATAHPHPEEKKKNKNAERWRKWHENNKAEYNAKRRKAARVKAAEKRLVAAMPRAVPPPKSLFCPLLPPAPLPPMGLPNSYSLGAGLLSLYSSPYFAMGAMLRMPPPPPPVAMMAPTGMMMPFAAAAPQQQQLFVGFNKY